MYHVSEIPDKSSTCSMCQRYRTNELYVQLGCKSSTWWMCQGYQTKVIYFGHWGVCIQSIQFACYMLSFCLVSLTHSTCWAFVWYPWHMLHVELLSGIPDTCYMLSFCLVSLTHDTCWAFVWYPWHMIHVELLQPSCKYSSFPVERKISKGAIKE
jgi:hypothetical protein